MKIIFGQQWTDWYGEFDLISLSYTELSHFETFTFCLLGFYVEIWKFKKEK